MFTETKTGQLWLGVGFEDTEVVNIIKIPIFEGSIARFRVIPSSFNWVVRIGVSAIHCDSTCP